MGTRYTVKVVPPETATLTPEQLETEISAELDDVNASMSTWLDDSEISRFNRHGDEPFAAGDELMTVMLEAERVSVLSGGAFDITVGPLVDAWGFGPTEVAGPPTTDTIDALLQATGFELLEIDPTDMTLEKLRPTLRCDLSAIAKGYGVDRVAGRLLELGLTDFMVEIGGEVRAAGRNPDGELWRIGIERPELTRGNLWGSVELDNAAMATSGDYRNFYLRDGVRVSHTLDPRIGRPITHDLASVSVIHSSCMTADAFATAINVLGPVEGRALVEREGLAALFLIRRPDGGFDEWASPSWPGANTAADDGVGPDEVD
jgi:thiamine biosynthesis lipoprotein